MKSLLGILGALALLLAGLPTLAVAESGYAPQKVVYHFNTNDEKTIRMGLRNIQNHIDAVGADNLELKVVMHGDGVDMLRKAVEDMNLQGSVINLKTQGVAFQVCSNTLRGRSIDYREDLFDVYEEDIVPSGVAEVARLQAEGYTYLKP